MMARKQCLNNGLQRLVMFLAVMGWLGASTAWGVGGLDNMWGTYSCFIDTNATTATQVVAPNEKYSPAHGVVAMETIIERIYGLGHLISFNELREELKKESARGAEVLKKQAAEIEIFEKALKEKEAEWDKKIEVLAKKKEAAEKAEEDIKKIAQDLGKARTKKTTDLGRIQTALEKARAGLKKRQREFDTKVALEKDPRVVSTALFKLLYKRFDNVPAVVQLVHKLFHRPDPDVSGGFEVTKPLYKTFFPPVMMAQFVGKVVCALNAEDKRAEKSKVVEAWLADFVEHEKKEALQREEVTKQEKIAEKEEKRVVGASKILKEVWTLAQAAWDEKGPFPQVTTHLVMLGLLYAQTGLEPEALDTYFAELERNDIKVAKRPASTVDVARQALQALATDERWREVDVAMICRHYEAYVYRLLRMGSYPESESFSYAARLTTCDEKEFRALERSFPDCMDTTIRNVCNLLAFDSAKQAFSIDRLKAYGGQDRLGRCVELFYTTDFTKEPNKTLGDHAAWTAVISNIPYAAYFQRSDQARRDFGNDQRAFLKAPVYIKIPAGDQKNAALNDYLQKNSYEQVGDEKVQVFEIVPSIRNLIIALDWLLNLNLFEGRLATEFVRDDFVKTYMPLLCKKIALRLDDKISLNDIDARDQKGAELIAVKFWLSNNVDSIDIKTWKGHGDYGLSNLSGQRELPEALKSLAHHTKLPLSAFLLPRNVWIVNTLKDRQLVYVGLFSTSLDNPDRIRDKYELVNPLSESITQLFGYCALRHPDPTFRERNRCWIWAEYLHATDTISASTRAMIKELLTNADTVQKWKLCDQLIWVLMSKQWRDDELGKLADAKNIEFVLLDDNDSPRIRHSLDSVSHLIQQGQNIDVGIGLYAQDHLQYDCDQMRIPESLLKQWDKASAALLKGAESTDARMRLGTARLLASMAHIAKPLDQQQRDVLVKIAKKTWEDSDARVNEGGVGLYLNAYKNGWLDDFNDPVADQIVPKLNDVSQVYQRLLVGYKENFYFNNLINNKIRLLLLICQSLVEHKKGFNEIDALLKAIRANTQISLEAYVQEVMKDLQEKLSEAQKKVAAEKKEEQLATSNDSKDVKKSEEKAEATKTEKAANTLQREVVSWICLCGFENKMPEAVCRACGATRAGA